MFSAHHRFSRRLIASLAGVLAMFPALLLAATPASAVDLYSGDAISTVVSAAQPGDTFVLHGGVYPALTVSKRTWSAGVRVVAAPNEAVSIAGVTLTGVTNLTISGVAITGPTVISGGSNISFTDNQMQAVSIQDSAALVQIARNTIRPGSSAVAVLSKSHDITITGNAITGGQRNILLYGGVSAAPSEWLQNITITANKLSGASGDDVQITAAAHVRIQANWFGAPKENSDHNDAIQVIASDDLQIIGNEITGPGAIDADQGIILDSEPGLDPDLLVTNTLVANNLIHHYRGSGITVAGTTNTQIVNNTSYDNGDSTTPSAGLLLDDRGGTVKNTNLRVWNNIFSDIRLAARTARPDYEDSNCVRVGGTGPHDITASPSFIDRITYQLASDSPCIGRGATSAGIDQVQSQSATPTPTSTTTGPVATSPTPAPPANVAPTANAGNDLAVSTGAIVALNATGSSDPDKGPSPLTYQWSQVSGPSVAITTPTKAIASVTLATAATYVFRITVSDGVATASDNLTATVTAPLVSATGPAPVPPVPTLLVVGNPWYLSSGDAAILSRLRATNHSVKLIADDGITPSMATGMALVLISDSVDPAKVPETFRDLTLPIVTWKAGLSVKFRMAKGFVVVPDQSSLATGPASSPTVLQALDGTSRFKGATVLPSAKVQASIVGNPNQAAIYTYDKRSALAGIKAPARRVGLFMDDDTAAKFNAAGWTLFDTAVNWAQGG